MQQEEEEEEKEEVLELTKEYDRRKCMEYFKKHFFHPMIKSSHKKQFSYSVVPEQMFNIMCKVNEGNVMQFMHIVVIPLFVFKLQNRKHNNIEKEELIGELPETTRKKLMEYKNHMLEYLRDGPPSSIDLSTNEKTIEHFTSLTLTCIMEFLKHFTCLVKGLIKGRFTFCLHFFTFFNFVIEKLCTLTLWMNIKNF